jgi:hypothetical protein
MTAAQLAQYLHARQSRPGEWRCRCPRHRGKSATSLSIAEGSDHRVLVRCWAGCATADVLKAAGLRWSDLFSSDHQPPKSISNDPRHEIIATPETVDAAIAYALARAVVSPEEELSVWLGRMS